MELLNLIRENSFNKARKKIHELRNKNKEIIFVSDDDKLNRKIVEKENIDILLIELKDRKDFKKQRNSGFNQVLAKLIKKKEILLGINLDEIISSNSINKAKILARLRQNISICNKNKIKMKFIVQEKRNQRNIYDLKSLGTVLGMPTWMTKEL